MLPVVSKDVSTEEKGALPSGIKVTIAVVGIFWSFSYFAVLQEDVYGPKTFHVVVMITLIYSGTRKSTMDIGSPLLSLSCWLSAL